MAEVSSGGGQQTGQQAVYESFVSSAEQRGHRATAFCRSVRYRAGGSTAGCSAAYAAVSLRRSRYTAANRSSRAVIDSHRSGAGEREIATAYGLPLDAVTAIARGAA